MSQFLFVRHGQSQANADGVIGDPASPLTELGIQQAHATAEQLRGEPITKIVCSPYARAQQTAAIIKETLQLDVPTEIVDDLRERYFGPLMNRPKDHDIAWYYTADIPGVESPAALLHRMQRCFETLKTLARHDSLLVVGHAMSGYYLRHAARGKTGPVIYNEADDILNAEVLKIVISDTESTHAIS